MKVIQKQIVRLAVLFQLFACGDVPPSSRDDKKNEADSASLKGTTKPNETVVQTNSKSDADYDGGQTSGGGPGIVCRDSIGSIVRVESLDLYEGSILRGLTYPLQPGDRDVIVSRLVEQFSFDEALKRDLPRAIAIIKDKWHPLPAGVSIHTSNDMGADYAVLRPESCSIELIGYYEKDGKLMVAQSLYNAMTPTHQAAFLLHEALYLLARDFSNVKESKAVRELVATLFSLATEGELRNRSRLVTWPTGTVIATLKAVPTGKLKVTVTNLSDRIDFGVSVSCRGPSSSATGGENSYEQITAQSTHDFVVENLSVKEGCRSISISTNDWTSNSSGVVTYSASFAATFEGKEIASGSFENVTPGMRSPFPLVALYFE